MNPKISNTKNNNQKTGIKSILSKGLIVALVLIIGALVFSSIYKRLKTLQKLNTEYQSAVKECSGKPYMYIARSDPIEGVGLGTYYYEPSNSNYDSAKNKAFNEISRNRSNASNNVSYRCSGPDASDTYIEKGK